MVTCSSSLRQSENFLSFNFSQTSVKLLQFGEGIGEHLLKWKRKRLSPQHHHHNTITTTPSPQHHHHHTITTKPSPQHHHHNTITTTPSPQHHYHNTITITPLPQHHHHNTITTTLSPQHQYHNTITITPPPHSPSSQPLSHRHHSLVQEVIRLFSLRFVRIRRTKATVVDREVIVSVVVKVAT